MTWPLAEQEERDRMAHTLDALLAIVAVELQSDAQPVETTPPPIQLQRVDPYVNSYWLRPAARSASR